MDIILSRYAQARLPGMSLTELDLYDDLLSENDQDLYQWVTGQCAGPEAYTDLIADIAEIADAGK